MHTQITSAARCPALAVVENSLDATLNRPFLLGTFLNPFTVEDVNLSPSTCG